MDKRILQFTTDLENRVADNLSKFPVRLEDKVAFSEKVPADEVKAIIINGVVNQSMGDDTWIPIINISAILRREGNQPLYSKSSTSVLMDTNNLFQAQNDEKWIKCIKNMKQ